MDEFDENLMEARKSSRDEEISELSLRPKSLNE